MSWSSQLDGPTAVTISPTDPKIYKAAYTFCCWEAMTVFSIAASRGLVHLDGFPNSCVSTAGLFNSIFEFPDFICYRNALYNQPDTEIVVTSQPIDYSTQTIITPDTHMHVEFSKTLYLANYGASLAFLGYYESVKEDIHDRCKCDVKKWPPSWAFSRSVRNAIGHGRININDTSAPTLTWCGASIGPNQNTMLLEDLKIGPVELFVLMYEMAQEAKTLSITT